MAASIVILVYACADHIPRHRRPAAFAHASLGQVHILLTGLSHWARNRLLDEESIMLPIM